MNGISDPAPPEKDGHARPPSTSQRHASVIRTTQPLEQENRLNKRRSYSGAFKAEVLTQYLNGRKSLKELADEYHVHPNQIKNWKSRLIKRARLVLEDERRKGDEPGDSLSDGGLASLPAPDPEED